MDLPGDVKLRLKQNKTIKIKADVEYFHFEVLKREEVGRGLGHPRLAGEFLALTTGDSLESHDAVLADTMRRVYEQHKLGHETRYGPNAGGASNFVKKARQDAVKNETKGKKGLLQISTNFDHAIEWPGVDSTRFSADRYEGVIRRLDHWALPVPQLLASQSAQPQLMRLFEAMAEEERKDIALHLQLVGEAFGWGFEVTPQWGNECFRDERIFTELLKNGLASGPVSQTTYLKALNLHPETERAHKAAESLLPKEQTTPIYDAAHGPDTGNASAPNGRPAGAADKFTRNGDTSPRPSPQGGEGEEP